VGIGEPMTIGQTADNAVTVKRRETAAEESECSLCFNDIGDHLLFPCGHAGMCKVCVEKLTICPHCRKEVIGTTKIYRV
jgi:hypothetical protein